MVKCLKRDDVVYVVIDHYRPVKIRVIDYDCFYYGGRVKYDIKPEWIDNLPLQFLDDIPLILDAASIFSDGEEAYAHSLSVIKSCISGYKAAIDDLGASLGVVSTTLERIRSSKIAEKKKQRSVLKLIIGGLWKSEAA